MIHCRPTVIRIRDSKQQTREEPSIFNEREFVIYHHLFILHNDIFVRSKSEAKSHARHFEFKYLTTRNHFE